MINYFWNELKAVKARKYWKNPSAANMPLVYYEQGHQGSKFLLDKIKDLITLEDAIFEIGCNVGRNLDSLRKGGYTKPYGVEINPSAISLMKQAYPTLSNIVTIYQGAIEDYVRNFKDNQFDAVFSMAVLMHIPYKSDWIFPEIARIAKHLIITIEEETEKSALQFPRDYGKIFRNLGLTEVGYESCKTIKGLTACTFRAFRK